jgi:hypothetical protein
MERPERPGRGEIQPIAIEPTPADDVEAARIARLFGLLIALHHPFDPLLVGIGEAIVWEIGAWEESEFIQAAKQAVDETNGMPPGQLKKLCMEGFPALSRYEYLLNRFGIEDLKKAAKTVAGK